MLAKGFFELLQETKSHKIIEVFSLSLTFKKLEKVYLERIKKIKDAAVTSLIQETIDWLEKNKGQELVSYELDVVKGWYQSTDFSHQDIKATIEEALHYKKTSVFYIDKILHKKK